MQPRQSRWALARRKALLVKAEVSRYFLQKKAEAYKPNPTLGLVSLVLCLIGFLGVAVLLYNYKYGHGGAYFHGLPTRVLFVLSLGFAASPFLVSILHRVPIIFVVLPTVLLFLLYPLLSPYGLPSNRDPIYLFQFSQIIATTGKWVPFFAVTNQAQTYSFFPASAIFNAELASLTGSPLLQTFAWGSPVLRLLIFPFAIYAFTSRLFGTRPAMLGVFLYLGMPSIELNVSTQQDFAMPWLMLTLLAFVFIPDRNRTTITPLRILLVVFSSFIIISHHLSSYLTGGWLGGIVLLPFLLKGRDTYPILRSGRVAVRYLLLFLLYAFIVSYPIITDHLVLLKGNILTIINPTIGGGPVANLGATFPAYQTAWIFLSFGLTALLGFFVLRLTFRKDQNSFVAMNIIIGLALVAIAVPFLPTGFQFLALRLMEYAGLILAPAAAWWLVNHFVPNMRAREVLKARRVRRRSRAWIPSAAAALCAFLIFTGGNLAPLSSRDQFAPPGAVLSDAPRFVTPNTYTAALWAETHMNTSRHIFGDELAYTVYGGFGEFNLRATPYEVFNGTTINTTTWKAIHLGDYIVTDVYMTQIIPYFPGPSNDQPIAPLTAGEVQKFDTAPQYFDRIYQDGIFTVYLVINIG